ncbi:MAG: sporulation protein [Oscillospiraceae bacterium]|jgi:hypothetical protein|nr:sporulation protein [Oscillospiraceae bacterium]
MDHSAKIFNLLNQLGITANYTGFFYSASAVEQCLVHREKLLMVTKVLYPNVAKQYKTTWTAVERNIRTVINIAWKHDPHLLENLARRPLSKPPSPSEFLAILTLSLCNE